MTTITIWYYEEFVSLRDGWVSAYAGYSCSRAHALELMETRKQEYPRAKLRLVRSEKRVFNYRERNQAAD